MLSIKRSSLVAPLGALALGFSLWVGGGALAQTTATPGASVGANVDDHPAHIHSGTCANLGGIVAPLTDVMGTAGAATGATNATAGNTTTGNTTAGANTTTASNAAAVASPGVGGANGTAGASMVISAETSVTTVAMSLDDLLAGQYAVNVHLSPAQADVYIACGDIGGPRLANGDIAIGLHELNGSGFAGIAYLAPSATTAGSTDVSIFLAQGLMGTSTTTGVGGTTNGTAGNATGANTTVGGNTTTGNATGGVLATPTP